MRIRNAVLAMLCACATQQLVMAHPGHTVQPEAPHSLTHYLAHPDHLIQWFVIAVVIACAILCSAASNGQHPPTLATANTISRKALAAVLAEEWFRACDHWVTVRVDKRCASRTSG